MKKDLFAGVYAGKTVLLTGHTGFKGSWMALWLAGLGAKVVGYALDPVDNETLFEDARVADSLEADLRADVCDLGRLSQVVAETRPDFVFHLAAQPLVRLSYSIPVETFRTNVLGTINILEAVRQSSHPCQVVIITTDKCYENREWLHSYREEDAMGGHDPYSASKGCAELAVASYRRSFFELGSAGDEVIRVASARAGNVIGGGDWAADRIVPDCFRAIAAGEPIPVRNKVATRPWQHVLEPISGYLWLGAALASPQVLGHSTSKVFRSGFNFGPSLASNRTVAGLVEEILRHAEGSWVDQSDPNAPHEASKLNLAIDKAFHLLEWQPVWDFETTIANTASWYSRRLKGSDAAAMCAGQIADYARSAHERDLAWTRTHSAINHQIDS